MGKKATLIATAMALVAFCVPAIANADQIDLASTGSPLAVGTKIDLTSTNHVITTPFGLLICHHLKYEGELKKSTTTEAEGVGVGEGTSTTCEHEGAGIEVTKLTLRNLKASSAGTTGSFTGTVQLPVIGMCHFEATAAPWVIDSTSSDSIVFTNVPLVATPSFCGPATTSGTFTVLSTNSHGGEEKVVLK
jgi:hypothetical protein